MGGWACAQGIWVTRYVELGGEGVGMRLHGTISSADVIIVGVLLPDARRRGKEPLTVARLMQVCACVDFGDIVNRTRAPAGAKAICTGPCILTQG